MGKLIGIVIFTLVVALFAYGVYVLWRSSNFGKVILTVALVTVITCVMGPFDSSYIHEFESVSRIELPPRDTVVLKGVSGAVSLQGDYTMQAVIKLTDLDITDSLIKAGFVQQEKCSLPWLVEEVAVEALVHQCWELRRAIDWGVSVTTFNDAGLFYFISGQN